MSAANLGRYATGWKHGRIFARGRRRVRAWRLAGLLAVLVVGAAFYVPLVLL